MKKTVALVILIVTPGMAFAQATVSDENFSFGLVKQWTSTVDPTLFSVPKSGGMVELIAAPEGTLLPHPIGAMGAGGFNPNYNFLSDFLAANPGWNAIQTTGIIPIAAGRFNGGNVTLNNVEPGRNADYFLIGWSGYFSSYDAAYSAASTNGAASFIGISDIFTTETGDSTTIPPGLPGILGETFTGMTLAPVVVPEATTVALAGLGAAALVVFRRPG